MTGHEPRGEHQQAGDWPHDDWPQNDWPDDGDWPVSEPVTPIKQERAAAGRQRLLRMAIVAVVAAAAGASVALAVRDLTPAVARLPSTGLSGGGQHAVTGPRGTVPPGAPANLMLGGKVLAVSAKSITISAGPQAITAKINDATRFAGRVSSIAAVHVGDMVAAQISERNDAALVVTLHDPVSLP